MSARRDMMDQSMDFAVVPDLETYKVHVQMRTRNFVNLLFITANLLDHFKVDCTYRTMLSDKATGQVGSGYRLGSEYELKWDAAHLCNCTFQMAAFLGCFDKCSTELQEYALLIYTMSSATTQEYQKANVSSDKVIDSFQTDAKNAFMNAWQSDGPQDLQTFLEQYLRDLLARLTEKSEKIVGMTESALAKKKIYAVAIEAITEQWERVGVLAHDYGEDLKLDFARIASLK